MEGLPAFLSIAVGYLIGAISMTRLFARRAGLSEDQLIETSFTVPGTDEKFYTRNTGASNLGTALGKRIGCLVGILDMLKVILPTLAFRLLFPGQPYFLFSAIAGMVGHIWPVYYGFKGGRGYSSAFGSLLVVDPLGMIVCSISGLALGIGVFRNFSYVFLLQFVLIIPWMWLRTHDFYYLGYAVALNLIFLLGMIPEIRQIRKFNKGARFTLRQTMEINPMGASMIKMLEKIKFPLD